MSGYMILNYLNSEIKDTIKVAKAIIKVHIAIVCDCLEDFRISFLKLRTSSSSIISRYVLSYQNGFCFSININVFCKVIKYMRIIIGGRNI